MELSLVQKNAYLCIINYCPFSHDSLIYDQALFFSFLFSNYHQINISKIQCTNWDTNKKQNCYPSVPFPHPVNVLPEFALQIYRLLALYTDVPICLCDLNSS